MLWKIQAFFFLFEYICKSKLKLGLCKCWLHRIKYFSYSVVSHKCLLLSSTALLRSSVLYICCWLSFKARDSNFKWTMDEMRVYGDVAQSDKPSNKVNHLCSFPRFCGVFYSFSLLLLVLQSAAVFVSALLLFCCSHKQRSQHTLNWQLCLLTQSY